MSTPPQPVAASTARKDRITFARENVAPPSNLYVGIRDKLRIRLTPTLAPVSLTFFARLLRAADNEIVPIREILDTPTSVAVSRDINLAEGYLLSVNCVVSSGAILFGQAFAQAWIIRGEGSNVEFAHSLIAHYVTANTTVSWPGSPILGSFEGPGLIRDITGSNPAAGVEIAESVPTGRRWRLLSWRMEITPSATVIARYPGIILDNGGGGGIFYQCRGERAVFNGNASVWTVAPHSNFGWAGANHGFIPIPEDNILDEIDRIRSFTSGLQAGDDWGPPQFRVEEWMIV